MATLGLLNRGNMPQVLSLFDHYYKLGVHHARDFRDNTECMAFVERMRSGRKFGFIDDGHELSWKYWRLFMYTECRKIRAGQVYRILFGISSYKTQVAILLPLAMELYLKGISDWVDYPNAGNMVVFDSKKFADWGREIKPCKKDVFVGKVIDLLIARNLRAEEEGLEEEFPEGHCDSFANLLWICSCPLKYGGFGKDDLYGGEGKT